MSDNNNINEHQLNAFVDHELDATEREQVFSESESKPEIDKTLCEYRKLKDLVKHAYETVPAPQGMIDAKNQPHQMSHRRFYSAASLLIATGFLVGALVSHSYWPGQVTKQGAESSLSNDSIQSVQAINKVILHLESNDLSLMDAALTRAEYLLSNSPVDKPLMVEVVTNDQGLDLLRSDLSPFAQRISNLSDQNVVFIACARKIENLRNGGVDVNLLPQAEYHFTAFDRVVEKLQHGWSYEKI